MPREAFTLPGRMHRIMLAAFVLATLAFTVVAAVPAQASAKEFNVAGTIDCGRRSGQACEFSDELKLWTEDISGTRELVSVDISWIQDQIYGLHQDEAIDLEVRSLPDAIGGLQALGVTGEGNFVNRHNWGVREEYTSCNDSIRASVGKSRDDDEAMAGNGIKNCVDMRKR